MKIVRSSRAEQKFYIKLLIIVIICFFVIKIINQQITINTKYKVLQQTHEEIQMQEIKKQELRDEEQRIANQGEDVKDIARKRLDFAKRSEKVFVNS